MLGGVNCLLLVLLVGDGIYSLVVVMGCAGGWLYDMNGFIMGDSRCVYHGAFDLKKIFTGQKGWYGRM